METPRVLTPGNRVTWAPVTLEPNELLVFLSLTNASVLKSDAKTACISYSYWPLWIYGNAFWAHQCTCNFSSYHEFNIWKVFKKFVVIFIDDILVYNSKEEHLSHLKAVFSTLRENDSKVKLSKSMFGQSSVGFSGHIISDGGVNPDPENLRAMQAKNSPLLKPSNNWGNF